MKKKYIMSQYGIENAKIIGKEMDLIPLSCNQKELVGRDLKEIYFIFLGD